MPIVVVCGSCGHRAGAKEEWAGKRLKCPACGNLVSVPLLAAKPPSTKAPSTKPRATGAAPHPPAAAMGPTASIPTDLFKSETGMTSDPFGAAAPAPMGPAFGRGQVRPRKVSSSSKTLLIVAAAVGGAVLLGCAGLVALLLPAVQRARELARTRVEQGGNMPAPLPANAQVWTADSALVAQLGDEAVFDRYSIRLPKNFVLTPLPDSPTPPGGHLQKWGWAGPPTPRGDRHVISAILVDIQGRMDGNLDQVMAGYLQGLKQNPQVGQVQVGVKEKGALLGKPFVRARYTVTPPGAISMHSVAYVGMDGNRIITVLCGCADAEGSDAYRLLETSLLTVREK